MATVYVGNLDWSTNSDGLSDYFKGKGYGVSDAEVMYFRDGTRSKGWGLVTLANESDAARAISELNNADLDGRSIIVRQDRGATPKTDGSSKVADTKQEDAVLSTTKLYVGNLSWETTDNTLETVFSSSGSVDSAEVMKRNDGRSRGWGVVEMSSEEDAQNAIQKMNGAVIDERTVRVEYAKARGAAPAARRQRKPRRAREEKSAPVAASNALYVGNLPWSFGDDDLSALFKGMAVSSAKIQMGFDGRSRGYGIVSFGSVEEASRAIDIVNGSDCEGRTVSVRFDRGN